MSFAQGVTHEAARLADPVDPRPPSRSRAGAAHEARRGYRRPTDRLDQAREFLDYFGREALHHFRAEEEAIFPLLLDYFDERPELLVRTLLQHLKIHSCTTRLREEVDACAVNEDTLRELAELIQAHIRLEEKELFPLIEEVVPEEALAKTALAPRRRLPEHALDDNAATASPVPLPLGG